uniref:Ankyrin repeat protein n=1 Tax=Pithovirus LCPAC304 TaxID=2506594 RepID=A0A481ZB23_9VIRU|nr:MAG: hypothetical protein LCPAC304_02000 [Pithovirus LCPAC304]
MCKDNTNVITWAINNGCPWSIATYIYAQKHHYTDVIKSMAENIGQGQSSTLLPWSICLYASKFGNLELLKWAASKGYPQKKIVCKWAVRENHVHIIEWLNENKCPCNREYH